MLLPLIATLTGANTPPTHALPLRTALQYSLWAFVPQFILQSLLLCSFGNGLGQQESCLGDSHPVCQRSHPKSHSDHSHCSCGIFFCEMFRRYRNILPLGVAHAALGLMMAVSFSDSLLHHMRVGIGYLMLPTS
jgi:hypothetical protein